MHISSQSGFYFVVTARSKLIIFMHLLFYQERCYMIICFFSSYSCPRGRSHVRLVYAFQNRWKTNSHFDLGLLLFVITLVIFSSTGFILCM